MSTPTLTDRQVKRLGVDRATAEAFVADLALVNEAFQAQADQLYQQIADSPDGLGMYGSSEDLAWNAGMPGYGESLSEHVKAQVEAQMGEDWRNWYAGLINKHGVSPVTMDGDRLYWFNGGAPNGIQMYPGDMAQLGAADLNGSDMGSWHQDGRTESNGMQDFFMTAMTMVIAYYSGGALAGALGGGGSAAAGAGAATGGAAGGGAVAAGASGATATAVATGVSTGAAAAAGGATAASAGATFLGQAMGNVFAQALVTGDIDLKSAITAAATAGALPEFLSSLPNNPVSNLLLHNGLPSDLALGTLNSVIQQQVLTGEVDWGEAAKSGLTGALISTAGDFLADAFQTKDIEHLYQMELDEGVEPGKAWANATRLHQTSDLNKVFGPEGWLSQMGFTSEYLPTGWLTDILQPASDFLFGAAQQQVAIDPEGNYHKMTFRPTGESFEPGELPPMDYGVEIDGQWVTGQQLFDAMGQGVDGVGAGWNVDTLSGTSGFLHHLGLKDFADMSEAEVTAMKEAINEQAVASGEDPFFDGDGNANYNFGEHSDLTSLEAANVWGEELARFMRVNNYRYDERLVDIWTERSPDSTIFGIQEFRPWDATGGGAIQFNPYSGRFENTIPSSLPASSYDNLSALTNAVNLVTNGLYGRDASGDELGLTSQILDAGYTWADVANHFAVQDEAADFRDAIQTETGRETVFDGVGALDGALDGITPNTGENLNPDDPYENPMLGGSDPVTGPITPGGEGPGDAYDVPQYPDTDPAAELQARKDAITQIYNENFGRMPDQGGLDYWANSGVPLDQLEASIVNPDSLALEDQNRDTRIGEIYQGSFGRQVGDPGLDYWGLGGDGGTTLLRDLEAQIHSGATGDDKFYLNYGQAPTPYEVMDRDWLAAQYDTVTIDGGQDRRLLEEGYTREWREQGDPTTIEHEAVWDTRTIDGGKEWVDPEIGQRLVPASPGVYVDPVTDRRYIEGSPGEFVPADPGEYVEGTPGEYINGTPGERVEGTPGEYVDGTPGEYVDGTPGKYVDGVPSEWIEGTPGEWVGGDPGEWIEGTPGEYVDGVPSEWIEGTPGEYVDGTPGEYVDGTPGEYVDGTPSEWIDGDPGVWNPGSPSQFIEGDPGEWINEIAGIWKDGTPGEYVEPTPGKWSDGIPGEWVPGTPGEYVDGTPGEYIDGTPGEYVPGEFETSTTPGRWDEKYVDAVFRTVYPEDTTETITTVETSRGDLEGKAWRPDSTWGIERPEYGPYGLRPPYEVPDKPMQPIQVGYGPEGDWFEGNELIDGSVASVDLPRYPGRDNGQPDETNFYDDPNYNDQNRGVLPPDPTEDGEQREPMYRPRIPYPSNTELARRYQEGIDQNGLEQVDPYGPDWVYETGGGEPGGWEYTTLEGAGEETSVESVETITIPGGDPYQELVSEGYTDRTWIPGTTTRTKISDGYWAVEPTDGYWLTDPTEGYWAVDPTEGYWATEPTEGYWEVEPQDGYWATEATDGYWEVEPQDGYWATEPTEGYWTDPVEGYWEVDPTEGYWTDPVEGYWAVDPTEGYWATDPTEGYWAVDPTEGYWTDPVEGYWATDPTDGYWATEPTDGYWATEPTEGYWTDAVEGYWEEDPTEGYWAVDPTEGYWAVDPTEGYWTDAVEGYWKTDPTDGYWAEDPTEGYWAVEPTEGYWETFEASPGYWAEDPTAAYYEDYVVNPGYWNDLPDIEEQYKVSDAWTETIPGEWTTYSEYVDPVYETYDLPDITQQQLVTPGGWDYSDPFTVYGAPGLDQSQVQDWWWEGGYGSPDEFSDYLKWEAV